MKITNKKINKKIRMKWLIDWTTNTRKKEREKERKNEWINELTDEKMGRWTNNLELTNKRLNGGVYCHEFHSLIFIPF